MRKTLIDTDHINHVTPARVANATMAITDAVQDFDAEQQVVGAAAFFLLLCGRYRVDAGEMFRIASNVMTTDRDRPEFKGAQAYMENELS